MCRLLNTKIYILLALIIVMLFAGAAAWFYIEQDVPKKIPVRARQVLLR